MDEEERLIDFVQRVALRIWIKIFLLKRKVHPANSRNRIRIMQKIDGKIELGG